MRDVEWDAEQDRRMEAGMAILGEALKHDTDKLRYDLIPPKALEELAKVYTIGAKKYGDYNWAKGMDWHRVIGAMMRHMETFRQGYSYDAEGFRHLAAVAWCAFTLMEYERRDTGRDDRWTDYADLEEV